MSDYNQENLSDMSKKLIENIPGELKKSMSTSETRSMTESKLGQKPEDYINLYDQLQKDREPNKKN